MNNLHRSLLALALLGAAVLPPARGADDQTTTVATPGNYVLAANDLVTIKVFQEDDLSGPCRIAADGTVSLPLIGLVKVAGRTADEAGAQIARLLDERFLVNPQVSVSVTTMARRRFTILGQVARAGAYNMGFQDSIELLEAIGMAGGFTPLANAAKITIKRHEGARDVVLEVNGKDLASGRSGQRVQVLAGDTVTVGERLF